MFANRVSRILAEVKAGQEGSGGVSPPIFINPAMGTSPHQRPKSRRAPRFEPKSNKNSSARAAQK